MFMVDLEVKESKIHGKGVFAKQSIKARTIFYKISLVNTVPYTKKNCAYVGNGRWLEDNKVVNWVNHSCNPNTIIDFGNNNLLLIASRDIAKDEEITCDYDITEINGQKEKCLCNSRTCKGYFLKL